MPALFRSEVFRMSRQLMPTVMLLIMAGLVVLMYAILWSVTLTQSGPDIEDLRDSLALGNVFGLGLGLVYTFASLMAVVVAATLIGSEFSSGTIRALLPRARNRGDLLTAKWAVLAVVAFLVNVFGLLVAMGASALVSMLGDLDLSLGGDFVWQVAASTGRNTSAMLPYVALAFLVTLWSRSTAAGIGVGVAFLFVEGVLVTLLALAEEVYELIAPILLSVNVTAITSQNPDALPAPEGAPGLWQAAAVLALYIAAFVALSYWIFRRRDVTLG